MIDVVGLLQYYLAAMAKDEVYYNPDGQNFGPKGAIDETSNLSLRKSNLEDAPGTLTAKYSCKRCQP